jgi:hypothetical protein
MLSRHRDLATTDVANVERERAIVVLYERATERLHRILADLAKLGLEERKVRISEAQAVVMLDAIEAVVRHPELALDAPRQARARELLSIELTARN